jgi:hypothetical protein
VAFYEGLEYFHQLEDCELFKRNLALGMPNALALTYPVQSKEKYPNILTEFVGTLFNTTA